MGPARAGDTVGKIPDMKEEEEEGMLTRLVEKGMDPVHMQHFANSGHSPCLPTIP